jgi:hypothetical protein
MPPKLKDVAKDRHQLDLLKAFMASEHNSENFDFLFDRNSNDKIYAKWILKSSNTQVNLPSSIQSQLDKLAAAKKWSEMAKPLADARVSITKLVDDDVMRRFENYAPYVAYMAANNPTTKAAVAKMDQDIKDGATYFTSAIATVKAKGKPADRAEVNRMFDSGRMRHDKVHESFTELVQKEKGFTRATFATVF